MLEKEGYETERFSACSDSRRALEQTQPDLILLDWNLPDGSGEGLCRWIREKWPMLPVIFLTVRGDTRDIVNGFQKGADDYLVKPFDFDELLARIRAATRKYGTQKTSVLTLADLTVDTGSHTVTRGGKEIRLSAKEYAILQYMMQHQGTVISRARLEDHIWNYDYTGGSNVVDVYITYLRKKIDNGFDKKLLHTVRGAGWILKEEP